MINAETLTVNGKDWIKVSFKPLPELIYNMSLVKGAIFNPVTKLWAVPAEYKPDFVSKMEQHLILWKGVDSVPGGIDENTIPATPICDYTFRVKPFDYQIRGFNAIYERDFLILADEMGLGKSFQVITSIDAKRKSGLVKRGVIVCKASLLYNWRDEISKFTDLKAVIVAGTAMQRAKIFSELNYSDDCTFIILSYETFRICVQNLNTMDTRIGLDFLVCDEIQKCKNPQSQLGNVIHFIPFKYKYLLTGTPLPNTPLEAYNYLKLGGKISMNYWQFRYRYAIMGGYNKKEVVGYKNIKELKDLIQENMLRRLKKDKLKDLPDKLYKTIVVEMEKGQRELYNAVKQEIMEDLKDTTLNSIPTALAKLTRLQQVTDHPALIGSNEKSIKIEAVDDLLEEIIDEGGGKAILFSRFKTMVNVMYDRYKKYNPAMITGDVDSQGLSRKAAEDRARKVNPLAGGEEFEALVQYHMSSDRMKEVYRFQNDDECKIILLTSAGIEGLNLTASSHVICCDALYTYSSMDQLYSRAHRLGQKDCVNIYHIVCKDSIDEKVMKILEQKQLMAQAILDNGVNAVGAIKAKEFVEMMIN